MRTLVAAAFLLSLPVASAFAAPIATPQQAAADVLSDGYSRVALTERKPGGWDVWASKDGIAYEVQLDSRTGTVLWQHPLDSDD